MRRSADVAVAIASPVAVPPLGSMLSIAAFTTSRSRVGLCSTRGVLLKATHAHVQAVGDLVHEPPRRPLCRDQPAGLDVRRGHRARYVRREHHRCPLDRHGHRALRLRGRDHQQGERERDGRHRRMAAPARAPRRDRGLQRGRGERRRGGAPAALLDRRTGPPAAGSASSATRTSGDGKAHGVEEAGRVPSVARHGHVRPVALDLDLDHLAGAVVGDGLRDVGGLPTSLPSMPVITSPVRMPARSAGPPETTLCTSAPLWLDVDARRRLDAQVGALDLSRRGSGPARPARTVLDGTAKPMPTLPWRSHPSRSAS